MFPGEYFIVKRYATLALCLLMFIFLALLVVQNIVQFKHNNQNGHFNLTTQSVHPNIYTLATQAPNKGIRIKAARFALSPILTNKKLRVCQFDVIHKSIATAWLFVKNITLVDDCEISAESAVQYQQQANQTLEYNDHKIVVIEDKAAAEYQLYRHADINYLVPRS